MELRAHDHCQHDLRTAVKRKNENVSENVREKKNEIRVLRERVQSAEERNEIQ